MSRPRRDVAAAACALAIIAALAGGCFSERTHGGTTGPVAGECAIPIDSPIIGTTGALIAIRGFGFHPAVTRVKPGTTVTWINCEPAGTDEHTSTSNAALWDSPFLAPGETYSFTFGQAGTFAYHCLPHPFMTGSVIVE